MMNVTSDCCTVQIPYALHLKGFYITSELLIAVLAITGNTLVCLAVIHNKKLRTVTNHFLVSLAVADILVGLVAIPCALLTDLGQPRHNLPLCMVLLSILMVLTQSSILSMLAVAAERYMAILLPFQYQRIMSPRKAQLALLLTWSMAAICGSVPLMHPQPRAANSSYCIFACVVDMTSMVYFNNFCCFLLPLATMFIIYGHIFLTIHHQIRRIAASRGTAREVAAAGSGSTGAEDTGSSSSSAGERAEMGSIKTSSTRSGVETETRITTAGPTSTCTPADPHPGKSTNANSNFRPRRELRKATSLFLLLFLFMMCWMPIHLINTVQLLCPHCKVPLPISLAAILLSHANSALNPILYAYRMRSFRCTLIAMLRGIWSSRPKPQ